MTRLRKHGRDLLALLLLFALPLIWFGPILFPALTGHTLLPYDSLYSFEPWRSMQPGLIPHNNLLLDLVLENAVWKLHINRTLADGQLPLWNPQIFTGLPFLAAGQASTLYPLNILFYTLPLEMAYGWFTALQIGLAGINMYLLGRVLRLRPVAALFSGVVFMFSGFLMVSVVFTMFIAAAAWLPLLLAVIELIIRKQEEKGAQSFRPIPYMVAGAAIIGVMILAGHPELIYYTLLVAGIYTAARLVAARKKIDELRLTIDESSASSHALPQPSIISRLLKLAGWLLALALLGIGLGAVQLLPLTELLPLNFREGSASFGQVLEWAWPSRHVLALFLPNVFGNPSHHQWFDIWQWQWIPATTNALGEPVDTIFWGIKNYVEGGNYLGIVTWLLAAIALLAALPTAFSLRPTSDTHHRFTTRFFAALAIISLLFAFGTRLYAILFFGLPGWSQLHSPFRWVFPFTISMALLGGIGLELLCTWRRKGEGERERGREGEKGKLSFARVVFILAVLTGVAGLGALAVVLVSMVLPGPFVALAQRAVERVDLAQMVFADGRMFWSYEAVGLAKFGLAALLSGALVLWMLRGKRGASSRGRSRASFALFPLLLIALVALDLYAAHGRFNPAAPVHLSPLNPANVPPVVQFINQREGISMPNGIPMPNGQSASPASPPFRFTTFDAGDEKTFNANVGMYYGWHDVRGYDSVIPRQYVNLMDQIAPQENQLLYNRIAPLYLGQSAAADTHENDAHESGNEYAALDNPLLDLLNVKYVLTAEYLPNPSWREIYRDAAVAVYENAEVLPRAFVARDVQIAPIHAQPLLDADLSQTLFLEETPADPNALIPASPELATATISRYTANDVFVDVNLSDRGWLVLSDAWFPGWKAYLRPFGADENQEEELLIYRANGAFRAIYLPQDGQWTVRFVYSPMSFKLGLYTSFLSMMTLALLLGWWAWGRYYRPEATAGEARTVAKNSLVPMVLNLINKAIDFAFAMLYVRLLGPEGAGKYYFVVALYGFFEIISRYGLGTLLARDVAADKNQSSRYLTNVLALRTLLWLVAMPLLALVTYGYSIIGNVGSSLSAVGLREVQIGSILIGAVILTLLTLNRREGTPTKLISGWRVAIWLSAASLLAITGGQFIDEGREAVQSIGRQEIQAIALLAVAMLFANWADALSNMFNAFEKMEYPAGLASVTSLLKVTLGALVLLLGWGFVGLAGVSLLVNVAQLFWLYGLLRSTLFKPERHWDGGLQKWMMGASGPLMINHLLATIFWRIDIWILRPVAGAASIGLYSVGIKYLDGLNIIPSVFTMAIFPLMSRYARNNDENLLRSYVLSVRLLILISLPIAMMVTFLAEPLVWLVGGSEFINLPETIRFGARELHFTGGANLALQLIIWSIPIGFVNSVTQFVLIAVNQQRYLTKAFILGVVFNTVGNLLVIPSFGYLGAAVVTILSEFSLLFPFYHSVKRHVGVVPWLALCLAPALSVTVMGVAIYALIQVGINVWLAALLGWLVYAVALLLTGALSGEDMAIVWRALPLGPLKRVLPAEG